MHIEYLIKNGNNLSLRFESKIKEVLQIESNILFNYGVSCLGEEELDIFKTSKGFVFETPTSAKRLIEGFTTFYQNNLRLQNPSLNFRNERGVSFLPQHARKLAINRIQNMVRENIVRDSMQCSRRVYSLGNVPSDLASENDCFIGAKSSLE